MRGTRLLLVRHAETSAPDLFHGAESDVGLSAWGAQQSEQVGRALAASGASRFTHRHCTAHEKPPR